MNKVCDYYNNTYCEDNRLKDGCDNRHLVERENKKKLLDLYVKGKVLDCGAGTGLYTKYLVEKGFDITACDIVPKHVDMIKEKCKGYSVNCSIQDATALTYFDETFDTVLIAGPIYHSNEHNQKKILNEAYRVCKKGGIVLVDYLSDIHGMIQHMLLDNNYFIKNSNDRTVDDIFYYNSYEELKKLLSTVGFSDLKGYGLDGITRFLRYDINKLDKNQIKSWIDFVWKYSDSKSIIDLSEHCVMVVHK